MTHIVNPRGIDWNWRLTDQGVPEGVVFPGSTFTPFWHNEVLGLSTGTNASDAAANTAAIQAALTAGGLVQITTPGTYYLSAALIYDSDTDIILGPGVEPKMYAGANKAMLQPASLAAFQAGGTTVTLTWSSGVTFTVGWTAHGKTAGKAVFLWNGTGTPFIGVFKVDTVVDANSFTCTLPYTPGAAPSGTWKAIEAVQNVNIRGGLWNYNNPANVAVGLDAHAICVFFCENVHVDVGATNVSKYCINMGATLNCTGKINSPGTDSDGIKIYGPARNSHAIGATGTYGDDIVSIQNNEWLAQYQGYQPVSGGGEIYDCTAQNIHATSTAAASVVAIYVAAGMPMDRIRVENAYGYGEVGAYRILGETEATSKFGSIHYKNFGGQGVTNGNIIVDACTGRTLTYEKWKLNPVAASTVTMCSFGSSFTAKQVNFIEPDVSAIDLGWLSSGTLSVISNQADIDHVVITRPLLWTNTSATASLFNFAAGTCKMLTLDSSDVPLAVDLVVVSPSLPNTPVINLRNNNVDTAFRCVNVNSSCEIHISGNRFNNLSHGVFRLNTTSTVTLKSDGTNTFLGTSVVFTIGAGTLTGSFYGWDLSLDVGATGVTKTNGAYCFNSGSGRGTLTQNRLVTCTGAAWVQVDTPGNTF